VLLRRLTKHVKDQNWFAVFLDFIIVVFGVFIGLQVANWNEARGDRADEARFLLSLDQDMTETIEEIDTVMAALAKHEAARETLFNHSLNPDDGIAPDDLPSLISAAFWQFHTVEIRVTTFDTLRNSGRLGVIDDADLVVALQDLAALIESAEFDEDMELHILQRFSDPLLHDEVDMAAIMTARGLESGETHVPWVKATPGTFSEPEYFQTQKFRNTLLFRSASTSSRIRTFQLLREKSLDIRALIRRRLAELGQPAPVTENP